jgi:hypothetical protein
MGEPLRSARRGQKYAAPGIMPPSRLAIDAAAHPNSPLGSAGHVRWCGKGRKRGRRSRRCLGCPAEQIGMRDYAG